MIGKLKSNICKIYSQITPIILKDLMEVLIVSFSQKKNQKIIVNCMDGNVNLFSEPNIEYYLNDNDDNIIQMMKKYSI